MNSRFSDECDECQLLKSEQQSLISEIDSKSTARITREAVSDVLDVRAGRPPRRKSGPAG